MSNLSSATTHATNVATDLLICNNQAVTVGMVIATSVAPSIPGLSLSSNKLVLSSGYSWLLECHLAVHSSTNDGGYTAQFYNETDASYIGQEAICARHGSSLQNHLRQTRKVCRALILANDFGANSTMTIYPRITSETGTTNTYLTNYSEPCIKIVRIG